MRRLELSDTRINQSLQANPLYKDLIEFKDVFPESVPYELPENKGTRHEIELKPGSKYCAMKQWPLPQMCHLAESVNEHKNTSILR